MKKNILFFAVTVALAALAAQASDLNNSEGTALHKGYDINTGSQKNTDTLPEEKKGDVEVEKPAVDKATKVEHERPEGAQQHRR